MGRPERADSSTQGRRRGRACLTVLVAALAAGCGGSRGAPVGEPHLDGGPEGPVGETRGCELTRIVDGDTVQCDPVGRIRLIGMDTPERGQAPFGAEATRALARLAPEGTHLEVEFDVDRQDRYGRVLGYLWRPGPSGPLLLNWALVRQGYALLLTYPPNVRYVDAFAAAQSAARADGAGLWAVDGFSCAPRDFRAGTCGR